MTPFVVFVTVMALGRSLSISPAVLTVVQVVATIAVLAAFLRGYVPLRPSMPLSSMVLGALVFVVWVAPDILFGYRHSPLFENALTGSHTGNLSAALQSNFWFLALRCADTALLVPIVEELFWRSWLMRTLIDTDFLKVPLGTYAPAAFWITAVLFASEHGSYWEVGLLAGIAYNWWVIRTRNLADCILAHAVTNGLLAAYVIAEKQWQYWPL